MFTVVVVSMAPSASGAHDLRGELSLTRSAVLYADHVILLSPYTAVVQQVANNVVRRTPISPAGVLEVLRSKRPDLYDALQAEHDPDVLLRTLMATVQMQADDTGAASALEEIGRAEATGFLSTLAATSEMAPEYLIEAPTNRLFELLSDPSVHAVCDARPLRCSRPCHTRR